MCIKTHILSTLAYFDIFDYPLKKREIFLFLPVASGEAEVELALHDLLSTFTIFKLDEFYSIKNNYSIIKRRNDGNRKANQLLATAEKVSSLLSKFPYIRGIGISGSLSKNFADENSDIDFFIITKRNRVWITRTFLYLLLRVAMVLKKDHLFCINYFIDEDQLVIEEKNIYTATEIVTLLPMYGSEIMNKFFSANAWTKEYLPNNYLRVSTAKSNRFSFLKWIIEGVLNNKPGDKLDTFLMKTTSARWANQTRRGKRNKNGLLFSMKTSKHYAKHDPAVLQDKIIALHNKKHSSLLDLGKVKKIPAN